MCENADSESSYNKSHLQQGQKLKTVGILKLLWWVMQRDIKLIPISVDLSHSFLVEIIKFSCMFKLYPKWNSFS
jgi:hypothetical protein